MWWWDVTNASGTEALLQERGVQVDILEDQQGIALYACFCAEKPEQELEDWQGLSACRSIANARSLA